MAENLDRFSQLKKANAMTTKDLAKGVLTVLGVLASLVICVILVMNYIQDNANSKIGDGISHLEKVLIANDKALRTEISFLRDKMDAHHLFIDDSITRVRDDLKEIRSEITTIRGLAHTNSLNLTEHIAHNH